MSKGLAPFSIFFCKVKPHGDSRAPLKNLKRELENYFGKLGTTLVDSKIQFSVNFMFKKARRVGQESSSEPVQRAGILPPAPTFDSKTGVQVSSLDKNVCSESSENFIYLMQNLRIGNNDCLTFFDSGVNSHLIDGQLVEKEKLQIISSNPTALGVIGSGSVLTKFGNFRFNLGPEKTRYIMRSQLQG